MQEFLSLNYEWLRALHIIAVISWMAGLLYLPRLFVYHADVKNGSGKSEMLKVMERRLYKYIMTPAMIVTWVFGLGMIASNTGMLSDGWMHVKMLLVLLMTGFHHGAGAWVRKFANDANVKPAKFYRIMNEVPTLFMVIIVIMAVVQPF